VATPEYLQQVIISGQQRAAGSQKRSTRFGIFQRPSVTSLVWASLDLITVLAAGVLALRFRVVMPRDVPTVSILPDLFNSAPRALLFYLLWFATCLVFFMRSYGLYGPIQNRSGLHEQRMTVQATLVSGCCSAGLYICCKGWRFRGPWWAC
jgi:hypothetical protein